jgi:hypothetical protein
VKLLDKLTFEEVENIAAEGDLDPLTKLAHAAELRELRKLHVAGRTRSPLRVIRLVESLPEAGDVSAWKKLILDSRAVLAEPGAPDLVTGAKRETT